MAENINHYGAVTLRLNGTGNLRMSFLSLDKQRSTTLIPFTMIPLTDIEPTRLSNFNTQRAIFRFETTGIDEILKINRIIIHLKPTYTQYPGNV